MRVDLVVVVYVAALALSLPGPSTCDPLYVMSAPNLLRVGSPEKVFVEAQDYKQDPLQVKIYVNKFPEINTNIKEMTVELTPANSFQQIVEFTIPPQNYIKAVEPQYVQLKTTFNKQGMSKVLEKVVLLSFQSGYIYLQTDKTIYTPSSTVYYRIFALSPDFKPSSASVQVDILNQNGILMKNSDTLSPVKGIISGSHEIPELVSVGTWSLVARFSKTPQNNFTAEFEVKEYVLPTFEIVLSPKKSFFHVDDTKLEIDITARYLYGKDMTGMAFVMFGVITGNERRSLPNSLRREEIRDGKGVATLRREHITQIFPNINDIVDSSIYVHVSVLTETGSEMVEAEKKGIKIVSSPYSIKFWRTPKYFKPGMPFDVMLYISNPDGTPALGITVTVTAGEQTVKMETPTNGIARFTLNTKDETKPLPIKAMIKDKLIDMVAYPYQPKDGSQNYLHIQVPAGQQSIGDRPGFTLNPRTPQKDIDFTYLILSRGQIVEAKRLRSQGSAVLHADLDVTNAMVPSFRIVAYYHVDSEVVSDSVWVDVDDTCMGKLEIKADVKGSKFEPRGKVTLKISGDPGAKVGLVAVDKGVYVLNNKHRLTQSKIWDTVEKLDIACTAGSGKNSMGVFYDAGLMFETDMAGGTSNREVSTCEAKAKRRRRAVTIMEVQTTAAKDYTGEARQCCVDGMKKNTLGYSCERRTEFILDGPECKAAFLKCCEVMSKHRAEEREEYLELARSDLSEEEEDMDEYMKELTSRSYFPESWLWNDEILPPCSDKNCAEMPSRTIISSFPDTITSWEFSAISLSDTKGICVAETLSLAVQKDFFIDLKLPYSAVRHEQIEIRAILHNNHNEAIKVRVELYNTDGICSDATTSGKYRTVVDVAEFSTYAVPFVIVPMGEPRKYTIEVKAMVYGSFVGDGVKRELLVVTEGVPVRKADRIELDPAKYGGEQTRSLLPHLPGNRVPGSEANTFITIQGDDLGITIEKAISGEAMRSLIQEPGGCGEQNMFGITMPVTAANYLDKTNQWHKVGVSRRNEAVNFIKSGYNNQLKYRKADGSYGAWETTPSSTWLTAYVAKVFSMASDIISIEENVICSAIKWLILNSRLPDGRFVENAPVIYIKQATGDVSGEDSDISMTAFVLIAMQESTRFCINNVNNLQQSIDQAIGYLESRISQLKNPYAVAMASYGLATAGKPNKSIFYKFSSDDGTHWPVPGNHLFTLEATAYALLALVKMREFERAGKVVSWLNTQQNFGYGKASTQPTIMVFQAIAEYREKAKTAPGKDLHVTIGSTITRTTPFTLSFTQDEAFKPRTEKFELNEEITITAKGKGRGTLFMERLYYAEPKEENMVCNNFYLDLKLTKEDQVQYPQAKESYLLTIDVKFLSSTVDAAMSILDVSILTGFVVDETDLHKLLEGKDRYIQNFEKDNKLSDRGSLIIYINKISHKQTDRIAFRVHKVMDVGLLQPAAVTVYEYYSTENRCVKFYHTKKPKGELTRLCDKKTNICQCAEEMCSKQKNTEEEFAKRAETACEGQIDYVIKATLLEKNVSTSTDLYHFRVKNIKLGTDDKMIDGTECVFMAHATCRETLDLQENKSYLIMGAKKDVHAFKDGYQIVLGQQTWVEYWPTQAEEELNDRYIQLSKLAYELQEFGCGY